MLPSALLQMPTAFANVVANVGDSILRRHAASVLRDVLRGVIRIHCLAYEANHHPG